jgi:hypothetical protein
MTPEQFDGRPAPPGAHQSGVPAVLDNMALASVKSKPFVT